MLTIAMDVTVPDTQKHLLAHWDGLAEWQRDKLANHLRQVDFPLMARLFKGEDKLVDWERIATRAKPPAAIRLDAPDAQARLDKATVVGRRALSEGQLGIVLVAGGQGSRLGFEHPKGLYPIGPLSKRSLFQFHIDQIRAIGRRFGVSIPLYLMTSPATHAETVAFLETNKRFGLPESDLHIFCQGTMPAVDAATGKLIMEAPDKLFLSPDGHGGTLAALDASGCFDDMEQRGITQLFYFQVDNPLVQICQPDLIGNHLLAESELSTLVVAKQNPMDKVGNVVMVDGKMTVIEYSDLPSSHADRLDEHGKPVFWAGNIAVHVFSVEFMRRATTNHDSLPFHRASKRVPYVDSTGQTITPSVPNAIKFEKFIFDLMPLANNPIVVEAQAAEVFAPLKNASGAAKDTPESTRDAIVARHRRMLQRAGVSVDADVSVEINPMYALDAEELKEKLAGRNAVTNDEYFE